MVNCRLILFMMLSFSWLLKTSHGQILDIPENNHGVKPDVLIDQEMNPVIGNLIKTVPRISTENKVTLDFVIHSLPSGSTANLIRLNGDSINGVGGDIPKVFIHPSPQRAIQVQTAINGTLHSFRIELGAAAIDHHQRLEIEQRYLKDGIYKFVILLNGNVIHSTTNADAKQFYNVKCFVSGPGSPRLADATISYFSLTNFL
ncbi:uncharacterized protein [Clytia hemisphaerica]|uniref:Uncharacterized protein n=1 Tax=Clytia hemisphaerica TaxID=252671 RepID=A0A7M5V3U6_9CNID|eukprot:TCONS_00073064-protein